MWLYQAHLGEVLLIVLQENPQCQSGWERQCEAVVADYT